MLLRLDEEDFIWLKERCAKEGVSYSKWVEGMLRRYRQTFEVGFEVGFEFEVSRKTRKTRTMGSADEPRSGKIPVD